MEISVRQATDDDIDTLTDLYAAAEPEQTARKPVWALTDGLDHPVNASWSEAINANESWVLLGSIDGVPVGFVWATLEEMLGRAQGARVGRIRLVYTDPDARGVGVGHEMLETMLGILRSLGIAYFDAPVGPGQRLTKNFFEGHGFAARSLIMHHADATESAEEPDDTDG